MIDVHIHVIMAARSFARSCRRRRDAVRYSWIRTFATAPPEVTSAHAQSRVRPRLQSGCKFIRCVQQLNCGADCTLLSEAIKSDKIKPQG